MTTPLPQVFSTLPLAALQAAPTEGAQQTFDFWQLFTRPAEWADRVVALLPLMGKTIAVVVFFWVLLVLTRPALSKALQRSRMDAALVRFLVDSLYRWTVLVVALVMAAAQLGIDVGAAIAGLGVAGIAVGLAAQDSIANGIAGVVIFMDRPFTVGDWITVSETNGRVAEIKMRTTRIRTRQNTYMVVPNKHIVETVLINHSMYGDVRVDIPIGIAYKEDIQAARATILAAIEGEELIRTGKSEVVVDGLGDSSVNLQLRVWVDDPHKETQARFACVEKAKVALDAANIQIPFPHLQVFFEKVEAPAVEGLRRALAG